MQDKRSNALSYRKLLQIITINL